MDVDSGKVLATPAIGQGVDANSFDPGTQLAVSLNDEGTPTVVHENSPDKFTLVAGASTQRRPNHNSGFEDPPYLSGDGGLLPIARGHAGASSPTAADGPPYVCAPSG